jgi:hypothetical protein
VVTHEDRIMSRGDRELPLEAGPWFAMVDALSPAVPRPGRYLYGQNIYPLNTATGERMVGRPGRTRTGVLPFENLTDRRVQGIGPFTKPFTAWTCAVAGGEFFTYNWVTGTWQGGPLTSELTSAGITIDPDAPMVAIVQLRDKLLISDGVNPPWYWDGAGFFAANVTKLTNCPPLLGIPKLRAGRLLGIKASDPTVLVWSETDAYNTGYEAGGYNNAMRATQSNPGQLAAIDTDNEGITLFRARSTTRIYGTDPQAWSTGNTQDTLDETEGTLAPWSVIPWGAGLVAVNADMQPMLFRPYSAEATPLWEPLEATIAAIARRVASGFPGVGLPFFSQLVLGASYTPAKLLLLAYPDTTPGPHNPESTVVVLDGRGRLPVPVALWTGLGVITAMGMVRNDASATGDAYLMIGDGQGHIDILGNPSGSVWNDLGGVAIEHMLETQGLGYSVAQTKTFDRLAITGQAPTPQTLQVELVAPDVSAPPQELILPASTEDVKGEVGTAGEGRWCRARITHDEFDEQFGISALAVTAIIAGRAPAGR